MDRCNAPLTVTFNNTERHCPIGDITGKKMMADGQIPVISCEGSCIRGEIARLAANMLAKEPGYGRGCHGEFFSVPGSAMAKWAGQAEKIVVIDGCFLHCHGRIMEGLFHKDQLAVYDALSYYGKYTDIMDIDGVPEPERRATAEIVLNKVVEAMNSGCPGSAVSCGNETTPVSSCSQVVPTDNSACGS